MKNMIILMAVLCLVPVLYAQEKIERKGEVALQFGFNSSTILAGNTYGIGGKYWYKDDWALKAGLSIAASSTDDDYTNSSYKEMTRDAVSIQTALEMEKHFNQDQKLSPFIGGIWGVEQL